MCACVLPAPASQARAKGWACRSRGCEAVLRCRMWQQLPVACGTPLSLRDCSYSRMGDAPDDKDSRAQGGNPCLEQTLESYELCCLVETFPNNHKDLDDFKRTLKVGTEREAVSCRATPRCPSSCALFSRSMSRCTHAAAPLALQYAYLYAKTVTLGRTHWPTSNRVMLRNRRIGCSMSGIAQFIAGRGAWRAQQSGHGSHRHAPSDRFADTACRTFFPARALCCRRMRAHCRHARAASVVRPRVRDDPGV